ncbi:hypothetical protein JXQ31_12265 [candidate division KSB1 bacterium]|nr:hypothetical protein [candidate division KSB1 bacterium]
MNYSLRIMIYLVLQLMLFLTLLLILFFIVMLFLHGDQSLKWLDRTLTGIICYFIFMILNIFRKKKWPVPGIDYF